jgi:hypothetical protein
MNMAKKANQTESQEIVQAIKGFDADFKCRDFQYEVGKTYEIEGDVSICSKGFHACDENPFDVWGFYPIIDAEGKFSRYAVTTHSGAIEREKDKDHSKIASAKITIDAEITLPDFIKRAVAWVISSTKGKDGAGDNSGYSAQIGSSGYYAKIGSSGDSAQIGSSGDYAKIGSSGDSAQIGSSGDYAKIGSSGDSAQIGSSGDSAKIGSSGYYAKIGSSGDYAKIGSSGYYAQITAEGKDAVIASAGPSTRVKAVEGSWISVAEYDGNGKCIGFATGCAGKDGVPADVWLIAKGGKLVAS